jgi:predicted dehydrogenase
MKAGKDVYCEKPLTHNVNEAKVIMAVAKKTGRLLQTGAMQRSGIEFRIACEIVRNGFIGDVKKVDAVFGGPSCPPRYFENPAYAAREGAPNPDVDFGMWCGPAPLVRYSDRLSPRGVHRHYPGFWRGHDYFGMGGVGDFGAHNLDIAQWGLGMDESGPVKIVKSEAPPSTRPFDGGRRQSDARLVFGNGAEIRHVPHRKMNYVDVFYGTEGAVAVDRGIFAVWLGKDIRQLPVEELKRFNSGYLPGARKIAMWNPRQRAISDRSLLDAVNKAIRHFNLKKAPIKLYRSLNHPADLVNCFKTRQQPNSRAEVGARAAILCNLLQLSYVHDAGFDWNPLENVFANGTGKTEWLDGFYAARNNLVVRA